MSKFKVGDKVRILDGSNIDSYFGHWVGSMKKHVGKVYTIESVLPPRDGKTWGYHMKEIGYIWDERALELARKFNVGDVVVAKKNNGYGITTDGWKGIVTDVGDRWFKAKGFTPYGGINEFKALEYDHFDLAVKFEVGDIVVAKKNNGYLFTTDGWKGVVTKTTADWFNAEEVGYPKQKYYHLKYDSFDLADEPKIVITREGKTTIAKLYEGKQVTKTAKARCNPSDKFDFNIGAAIALERLTDCAYGHFESTVDSDLQWNRFIANKLTFKVPVGKIEKFLKECEERGLTWCTGDRATNWNPVKKVKIFTFSKYVYMHHDDDGLSYCDEQFGDYEFKIWDDFDWEGFKADKFNVVVTRDSIDRFLEECDAHEIAYCNQKASEFNPIKDLDKINPFLKSTVLAVLDPKSTDECEFEVKDGELMYSFDPEIKKSTVRYD